MITRSILSLVFILAISVTAFAKPADAQVTQLNLAPTSSKVTAKPGQTVQQSIKLQNTTNQPLTVNVIFRDFEAREDKSGSPKLLIDGESNQEYGLSTHMSGPSTVTLKPNELSTYKYSIKVPADKTPRTYFGAVTFSQAQANQESDDISASLASLVFVTSGSPEPSAEIGAFSLTNKDWQESRSQPAFTFEVENTSKGLITPEVKLDIINSLGEVIETTSPEESGSVLPDSSRAYKFKWNGVIDQQETYYAQATASIEGVQEELKSKKIEIYKPEVVEEEAPAATAADSGPLGLSSGQILIALGGILAALIAAMAVSTLATRRRRRRNEAFAAQNESISQGNLPEPAVQEQEDTNRRQF